jgi:Putative lumazine-binding
MKNCAAAVLVLILWLVGCSAPRGGDAGVRLAGARAGVAGAQEDPREEAEILATIDRFFVAMAKRDSAAYGAEVIGEGMTFIQIWKDGVWELRQRRQQEWTESLAKGSGVPNETYWDATVLMRGPIAVVWAPYRLAVDGEEFHRGIDVFDMVKVDGRWKIANAMWTSEPGQDLAPRSPQDVRPEALR